MTTTGTGTTGTASVEPTTPAPPERRADIQGLRAVAVVAVIANHVLGWPAGGFVGVDVFFVISGFLITGLILREHDGSGRFSLADFYRRRFRRIAPAAITVLAVTVAVGFVLFNRPRAISTALDGLSSLLFVANWRFDALGTDYFHAADVVSPLQHYWSLSVEEQFYLAWPALMLLVLVAGARVIRRPRAARVIAAVVLAAIIALSLSFAVTESVADPTSAYFSTLTRAWEIAAGALLAVAAPLFTRVPVVLRVLAGWLGLAGIVGSVLVISDTLSFPAPWALLPVVATVLVLAAGIGRPQPWLFPIVNPLTTFIGTISYSLYLWHLPVVIVIGLLLPGATLPRTLLSFGAILVLVVLSFFLIEQPFHRSPWLEPFGGSREKRRAAWSAWRDRFSSQFAFAGLGLLLVVAVSVVAGGVVLRGPTAGGPVAAPAPQAEQDAGKQLVADLSGALAATSWPGDLSPSLDDAIARTSENNPARACFDIGATPDVGSCTWGDSDAPHHLYLVGDSTAMAYAPAFKAIAESSGGQWKATTIGLYGCRFTAALVQNDGAGVMDECPQRKTDVANAIVADHPQLVVVANAFALGQAAGGAPLSVSDLVTSTAAETARYGVGQVVTLAPPPLGAELGSCYSAVSTPHDCTTAVGDTWRAFARASKASGGYVSSLPFTCVDSTCPAFAGTLPIRYDTVHLTPDYATHIAPVIHSALVELGVM